MLGVLETLKQDKLKMMQEVKLLRILKKMRLTNADYTIGVVDQPKLAEKKNTHK